MINNIQHGSKHNYDDVFLRDVLLGFYAFIKDRVFWYNISEELGSIKIDLPYYYRLKGDIRYIMDAFYDDMPTKRVNMNTDQIPRAVMKLANISPVSENFTNPNIYYNINVENNDDELIQITTQIKFLPVRLTVEVEFIFSNEIDVFKAWQVLTINQSLYKMFPYSYKNIPMKGVFVYDPNMTNPLLNENSFGTNEELKITTNYVIDTSFPIIDYENIYNQAVNNNKPHLFQFSNNNHINSKNNPNVFLTNKPVKEWLLNVNDTNPPSPDVYNIENNENINENNDGYN